MRPDMTLADAMSLFAHWTFDRKYEDWDTRKPSERLVPTADERVKYPFRPELGDRRTYAERHGLNAKPERKGLLGTQKP